MRQVVDDEPIWPRIFYLIRSGCVDEALSYALSKPVESTINKAEPNFLSYFKAWSSSSQSTSATDAKSRRLPKLLRDRFLNEYNQRIRYLQNSPASPFAADPFKLALYKLIGRAELSKKNVPGVTDKSEHWLWLQLSLVREDAVNATGSDATATSGHDRYALKDLSAVLNKFGEKHWDPTGKKPGLYFQVLLMSGQFEKVRCIA